jgi:hypothetical protein
MMVRIARLKCRVDMLVHRIVCYFCQLAFAPDFPE